MKTIKYDWLKKEPKTTNEGIVYEDVLVPCEIKCATEESLQANLVVAEKEAVPGSIEVTGEFDPVPVAEPTADEVLNAMLGVM